MIETEKTTIELRYLVIIDGTEMKALCMRRPKVRDQILMEKSGMAGKSAAEKEVLLFANLCEIAPGDVEELDMGDYRRLQEAYSAFLEE